jgi:hypothetical protein
MPNLHSSSSRKDYNRIIGSSLQETLPTSLDSFADLHNLEQLIWELRADGAVGHAKIILQNRGDFCSKEDKKLPLLMDMQENN